MSFSLRGRLGLTSAVHAMALMTLSALPAQVAEGDAKQDTPAKIPADGKLETHPASGIQYSILKPGDGKSRPGPGDKAAIRFWEWTSDGTLIQSANEAPVGIDVADSRVPLGLTLAPLLITKGGKVKLTIPPEKAYGKKGVPGSIPPDSTMVYVVELVDFQYRPKPAQFIPGDPKLTKVTRSGLKYQVLEEGSGDQPGLNDITETEFTTWSMTGELLFGSFRLGRTMRAPIKLHSHPFLQEVLPLMKNGGVWRVVVPANQTVEQMTADTVWQIKLIDHETPPTMPPGDETKQTTTKSGLQYERLATGTGDRPRDRFACELEFDFWRTDGTFVAGSRVEGANMQLIVGQKQYHKFLDEMVLLMQIGDVLRVEVPETESAPRLLKFPTVWRLKLLKMKEPLPIPEFALPKADELTATASGLKYKVLERGDGKGPTPRTGQNVVVHYCGWLTDGKRFDSSYEKSMPANFRVGDVIPGWNEGLQLMKPGDTFVFVIPSKLGYADRGTPDGAIPPGADLVFLVKLLAIQ